MRAYFFGPDNKCTRFCKYESDYDYICRALSSDHRGFSRYRSLLLLLLLLLLIILLLSILLCIKSVTLLDSTFSRLQLITDFFVPRPSWILQYILLSKVGDCF